MLRGVVVVLVGLGLAACAPPVTPAPVVTTPAAGPAPLPALIGSPSLSALQTLRANGFQAIGFQNSGASPGRDWTQDHQAGRSWTVCFQAPAAGERERSQEVILGIVPPGEACPDHDAGWEYSAYDSMSIDWTGSTVTAAVDALKWQRRITLVDGASHKKVKAGSRGDWTVCAVTEDPGGDEAKATITASADRC